MRFRRLLRIAFVCCVVFGTVAPLTAGTGAADTDESIVVEYTFAATDDPGRVRVVVTLQSIPDDVTSFRFSPSTDDLRIQSTRGFSRENGDIVWDGRTESPTVTYTAPTAPGSARGAADERSTDGLGTANAENWTYLAAGRLTFPYSYRYYGADPGVETQLAVEGRGIAGPTIVFLGEHRLDHRVADGQAIWLVTPRAANFSGRDRKRVFATLTRARTQLRVGAADDRVNVFVTPAPIRRGGVAFPQRVPGRQDVWVRDVVATNDTENTWLHEYVHTRQAYDTATEMRWFTEASAEYYAALLSLRQSRVSYAAFREHVTTDADADARLSAPGTWGDARPHYTKGRRVLAALDVRIRRASNGSATLLDVFRRMNAHDDTVTYDEFTAFVAAAAGRPLDDWLDRHVRGRAAPAVPDSRLAFTPPGPNSDTDGDGLGATRELDLGTSPFTPDSDDDGLSDPTELDGRTDPLVADTDDDGLADGAEVEIYDSVPVNPDTDDDGLADGVEATFGSTPTLVDSDFDGLDDPTERAFGSHPQRMDTEDDGLTDPRERELGSDPTSADSDGDGLTDPREVDLGTDPAAAYTDGDRLTDPAELDLGTDPTRWDTDGDELGDAREARELPTDPLVADTDGDGHPDGPEVRAGTDPVARTHALIFFFAKFLP